MKRMSVEEMTKCIFCIFHILWKTNNSRGNICFLEHSPNPRNTWFQFVHKDIQISNNKRSNSWAVLCQLHKKKIQIDTLRVGCFIYWEITSIVRCWSVWRRKVRCRSHSSTSSSPDIQESDKSEVITLSVEARWRWRNVSGHYTKWKNHTISFVHLF